MTVPSRVEELIADEPISAHVATSVDDRPHVAPVWYGYREGTLSILTGGKKLRNIRRNPRVAVSIEKSAGGSILWNVTLLGTATVITDRDRMKAAEDHIFGKYQGDGGEDEADDATEDGPQGALVEIRIGSATAQRY